MTATLRRHEETLAVARLGVGADVPAWATSTTLMSVTATAGATTVVCGAGAVPRKARPEGPFTAFEVVPEVGDLRATALVSALTALPPEADVRALSTADHDWLLVPVDATDLVVGAWSDHGLAVEAADGGAR